MKNIIEPEFVPRRGTLNSAGYDLYAVEDMNINPFYEVFDTGVCFDGSEEVTITTSVFDYDVKDWVYRTSIASQWVAVILPRSSMGFMHGLKFANTVCVIDQDYRNTIKVAVAAEHQFRIKKGDRFAQMIFLPYGTLVSEIKPTVQRSGGIGSTNNQ